jgi:phosphopantetheine--protein transferase-like protein
MEVRAGCDLVYLPRFSTRSSGGTLAHLFTPHELRSYRPLQSLAGSFAVKEAVVKALHLPPGSWQQIEVLPGEGGKPSVRLAMDLQQQVVSSDVSVSHDGEYVMALVIFLLSDRPPPS